MLAMPRVRLHDSKITEQSRADRKIDMDLVKETVEKAQPDIMVRQAHDSAALQRVAQYDILRTYWLMF